MCHVTFERTAAASRVRWSPASSSGVSQYVVVGPSRPGDGHRPGVSVGEPAGRVHFRSPRDDHFSERLAEVLRQERVQYRVQTRVGVRQTVADYLHDDADGGDLVIVDALQHQYDLQRDRDNVTTRPLLPRNKTVIYIGQIRSYIIKTRLLSDSLPRRSNSVYWNRFMVGNYVIVPFMVDLCDVFISFSYPNAEKTYFRLLYEPKYYFRAFDIIFVMYLSSNSVCNYWERYRF